MTEKTPVPNRRELQATAEDLLRRINDTINGFTALYRPFVEPCLTILATLSVMPESAALKVGSGDPLSNISDALVQEQICDPTTFVVEMRGILARARMSYSPGSDRLRQVIRCEIVFEEEVVRTGLAHAPDIAAVVGELHRVANRDKKAVVELVQLYGVEIVGRQVTFDPHKLCVAAQRRLMELVTRTHPKRTRSPTRPVIHPVAEKIVERLHPVDSDDALFTTVMGHGVAHERPALEHNPHDLGNFISDVSPVHSPSLFD